MFTGVTSIISADDLICDLQQKKTELENIQREIQKKDEEHRVLLINQGDVADWYVNRLKTSISKFQERILQLQGSIDLLQENLAQLGEGQLVGSANCQEVWQE